MSTITTLEGERWDTLSQRVYRRPNQYKKIWEANPDATYALRYAPTLPAGLVLTIPDLPPAPPQLADTPPWRK